MSSDYAEEGDDVEPEKVDAKLADAVRRAEKRNKEAIAEELARFTNVDLIDEVKRRGYEVKLASKI